MLVNENPGGETLTHVCDGITLKRYKELNLLPVYLHDVHAYIKAPQNGIKYCPHCGVEIDTEKRP